MGKMAWEHAKKQMEKSNDTEGANKVSTESS